MGYSPPPTSPETGQRAEALCCDSADKCDAPSLPQCSNLVWVAPTKWHTKQNHQTAVGLPGRLLDVGA
ncbi:hypothetical protein HYQ44_001282 [Verticillium longisporum]|nr:hypothetical protein HYQ44_001282 [Verticillium longisporum]